MTAFPLQHEPLVSFVKPFNHKRKPYPRQGLNFFTFLFIKSVVDGGTIGYWVLISLEASLHR